MRKCRVWVMVFLCLLISSHTLAAKVQIRVGHIWALNTAMDKGFKAAADAFMQKNPDIEIVVVPGYNATKFTVESAAGVAADIVTVNPTLTYGAKGLIQPLDQFVAKSKVNPADFIPAAWYQNIWKNSLWAIPLQVDPNFAFVWNKSLYREAGLNAEVGPTTIKAYDAYANKLSIPDADGYKLRQLGAMPWDVYQTNTIFTWGWVFGGDFYDTKKQKATADDPKIVQAVEWIKDHYARNADRAASLGTGLPPGTDTFSAGRLASRFLVSTSYFSLLNNFPNLELGIGPMPNLPESGVTNPAWIGGWCISLASVSQNPEAAWKFMEFISASQEGSSIWSEVSATMPGYIKSQAFRKMAQDSRWKVFADIAVTTTRFRPAIPSQGVYTSMFGSLLPKVLRSELTPIAALEQISQAVDIDMANNFGVK